MDQICPYHFALAYLLKSPSFSLKSTRSPPIVKSNCGLVQTLTPSPLGSLEFEPAVQPLSFCALTPESMGYLRFSPRFCPETPWNSSFLTNRSLELVFSLDYAFSSVLGIIYIHAIVVMCRIVLD